MSRYSGNNGFTPGPPLERPASTGIYLSVWENRMHELVELLTRSSLEHHKLDLMAEVSHLKMRLAAAEKDRRDADDRFRALQRQVTDLESKLVMKDAENSELRLRLGRNGTLPSMDGSDIEVEKLKRAVDALMASNEEKERKLEDMRRLLKRYRRVEEILVQAQGRKAQSCNVLSLPPCPPLPLAHHFSMSPHPHLPRVSLSPSFLQHFHHNPSSISSHCSFLSIQSAHLANTSRHAAAPHFLSLDSPPPAPSSPSLPHADYHYHQNPALTVDSNHESFLDDGFQFSNMDILNSTFATRSSQPCASYYATSVNSSSRPVISVPQTSTCSSNLKLSLATMNTPLNDAQSIATSPITSTSFGISFPAENHMISSICYNISDTSTLLTQCGLYKPLPNVNLDLHYQNRVTSACDVNPCACSAGHTPPHNTTRPPTCRSILSSSHTIVCSKPPHTIVCSKPPHTTVCSKPTQTIVCSKPPHTIVCSKPPHTIVCTKPTHTFVCSKPPHTIVCSKPTQTIVCSKPPYTIVCSKPPPGPCHSGRLRNPKISSYATTSTLSTTTTTFNLAQRKHRSAVEELLMNVEDGDSSSNSSSTTPSTGDTSLRDQQHSQLHPDDRPDRHYISSPSATSTPVHQMSSSMNGGLAVATIPPSSRQAMGLQRSNSCENLVPGSKSSSFLKKGDDGGLSPGGSSSGGSSKRSGGYGTLPKHQQQLQQSPHHHYHHHTHISSHNRSGSSSGSKEELRVDIRSGPEGGGKKSRSGGFHGLGKTLMRVRSGKRSSSAPNLGDLSGRHGLECLLHGRVPISLFKS
ncbi:liprin-beta-1 [Elysia marginata]|uniref:Liprin-beta-1 n=1 Tax=Elysia marginata TaxID=1093978 RepID=A0AAV4FD59_9GAST|nr:liprin-beta-1 [Elysia marginata]